MEDPRFNITHPSNTMLSAISGALGAIGIVGNSLLMYFILSEAKKRKPHEWLLFLLALGDLIFCANSAFLEAPFILNFDHPACKAAAIGEFWFGMVAFFTPPVVTCNRYLAMYNSQLCTKVFTNVNVFIIWLVIVAFSFALVAPFAISGNLGQDDLGLCGTQVTSSALAGVQICIETSCILATTVSAFCCYMVVKRIRSHRGQNQSQLQSRLIEESRELIIVMILIAALPIVTEVPAALAKLIQSFTPPFGIWVTRIIVAPFPLVPASNAYITMYVIKDYRKMVLKVIKREPVVKTSRVVPMGRSDMMPGTTGA